MLLVVCGLVLGRSLFFVVCLLLVASFFVRWWLRVVHCDVFVVCGLRFAVCDLFVIFGLWFVVRCLLSVVIACCLNVVGCC